MIFITGDCHGDYRRLNTQNFPIQKKLTRNDFIIVCGDFGFWNPSREQDWWLDWLSGEAFHRFCGWTGIMKISTC